MYVKIDLNYRVAYLVDDSGLDCMGVSGVTRSNVDEVLTHWGYRLTPDGVWEVVDILNAADAVRHPVESLETGT